MEGLSGLSGLSVFENLVKTEAKRIADQLMPHVMKEVSNLLQTNVSNMFKEGDNVMIVNELENDVYSEENEPTVNVDEPEESEKDWTVAFERKLYAMGRTMGAAERRQWVAEQNFPNPPTEKQTSNKQYRIQMRSNGDIALNEPNKSRKKRKPNPPGFPTEFR